MKNKLKILIIDKGYTNRKLASELSISEQTISNWCNNRNIDNIYNFYKLCKKLDIDIKDIFSE